MNRFTLAISCAITCLCLGLSLSATAQRVKADEVPEAVKAAFAKNYPDKTVSWWSRVETTEYDATVIQPKQQTLHVAFSTAGQLLFTCLHHPAGLVPTTVKSKVGAQHPGYMVAYANEVNSKRAGRYYFVWLESKAGQKGIYVNAEGETIPMSKADPAAKHIEMGSN